MWRRTFCLQSYATKKVSDMMNHVVGKKMFNFDHIAVDVGDAAASAVRMVEGDEDTIKFVARYIFGILLKRVSPKKSIALIFDGSDPLWKVHNTRKNPTKKFHSRFTRSAGSMMMYQLEEALRSQCLDRAVAPEVVIMGPGVPGPFEHKLSRWQLDLAARDDVSHNDSFCLFGGTDLYLSNFAMTPFHNLTNMTLHSKELKDLTVVDVVSEWLGQPKLLEDENRTKLSRVRVDVTFLLLLCGGLSCTDLGSNVFNGLTLKDALDGYLTQAVESGKFLFSTDPDSGDLQMDVRVLESILARMVKSLPQPKEDLVVADLLEMYLQTHSMLCDGGIKDFGFVPRTSPGEKTMLQVGMLLRHLKSIPEEKRFLKARRNNSFALTPAEFLMVGAPTSDHLIQHIPNFTGGHPIPQELAEEIVKADTEKAVTKTKELLSAVPAHTHEGLRFNPSHCWVRKPGEPGPPLGWAYHSVNIGVRSEMRRTRETKSTTVNGPIVLTRTPRASLVTYNVGLKAWEESPPPFEADYPKELKVVTWNVQFNRHSGETTPLGRPGIDWHTSTRYIALAAVLKTTNADVIAMQEVEGPWYDYLSQQDWVKENYRFSCQRAADCINPWGILMLVHRRLPISALTFTNVPGYTGHASVMPSVKIPIGKFRDVSVNSVHLLAPYQKDSENNRDTQLRNLEKRLDPKLVGEHCIVMGDFNDSPERFYEFPSAMKFRDAWLDVKGKENPEEGFSINGKKSKYTALIIEPEFFGRADRIQFKSTHLSCSAAELVGTKSVREVLGITTCPEYLFPSDHFGVSCTFKVRVE